MAIMNIRVKHLTERSGDAAHRVTQYFTREGEYAPAAVGYLTRTSADTQEYEDFVFQTHGNLPTWAQEDPVKFFTEAERFERGGPKRAGRWATTWQMALPKELTREKQWAMGRAFLKTHLAHHAYLCVMHDPIKDGEHQPHLHVLLSERTDHGQTPDAMTYFRRPEVGGCAKDRWFSQRGQITALREAWADWSNYTLEVHGHAARVHPRSLYDRDIDRKPEPKVGYGTDPELHAQREAIRQQRNREHEHVLAHAGWEARKAKLGISDVYQIAPADFLQGTYIRAREKQAGQWNPEYAALKEARKQAYREREAARLQEEVKRIDASLQHEQTKQHLVHRQQRHLTHRQDQAADRTQGTSYRVRLTEGRDYERTVGQSY